MTSRERDPVDAQYESIHMALTTKVSAPMVATAVKNLDALAARLEAAEAALRQAADCCARPPGVCFPRAEDAPDAHV